MIALKKYILSVMLVLLSASFVMAESETERNIRQNANKRDWIGHVVIYYGTDTSRADVKIKGYVIDPRVYTKVLSAAEVNQIYSMSKLERLIGKKIHRTRAHGINYYHVLDRSYIDEPRRLIDVTCKYIILEPDITDATGRLLKLDRDQWDDGCWEEWKNSRLSVRELIGTETAGFTLSAWTSSYRCVVCGEHLTTIYNSETVRYCSKCKKYFNIEKRN